MYKFDHEKQISFTDFNIADAAKKYHKPIRYFQYAGAAKCAEQIVIDEQ